MKSKIQPLPICSCCGIRGEGFKTRQGEWMLYDCANREMREAQESAEADLGDMDRKGMVEEALVAS